MDNNENNNSYSELEKRRIIAILGENSDLITMSISKIYTTNKNNKSWLYSGLEGFFCFILDFKEKRKFFVLYDLNNFELLFKLQLYSKFESNYKTLHNSFHCFETFKGFVGIKFASSEEANSFEKCVRKYDDNLTDQFFKKNINRRKNKYGKGKEFLVILKNIFCQFFENKNSANTEKLENLDIVSNINKNEIIKILDFEDFENSISDIEIFKPRFYEILLKITYDKEKKLFNLQNVPSNLKNLFKKSGIKKSDFKNESLALNIFKFFMKIFDELQNNKKNKTHNLEKIGKKKLSLIKDDPDDLINSLQKLSEKEINNLNKKSIPLPPKIPVPKNPVIARNSLNPGVINSNFNIDLITKVILFISHSLFIKQSNLTKTNFKIIKNKIQ